MKHFTLVFMAVAALCTSMYAQNRVTNLSTSLKALNVEQLQTAQQPVQITRILFAGYNTICLPVTLSPEQLQSAAKEVRIERLAAIRQEGATLNLYFIDCTTEGLIAGTPYLIYSPSTQMLRARTSDAAAISVDLQTITKTDVKGNRISFSSSWEAVQGDGRYGIPAKQEVEVLESVLTRTTGDQTFLPTRCGFSWESQGTGVTELEIKHVADYGGIETSLEELKTADAVVDIFDTQGVLVRKQVSVKSALKTLPRGVYVIDGAKVAVK